MLLGLIIFFAFIGAALVTLLILNKFAKKYLNGDFIKDTNTEDDDVPVFVYETRDDELENKKRSVKQPEKQPEKLNEGTEPISEVERERVEASPYEMLSTRSALIRIKVEGFANPFAANAKIKLSFEHNKTLNIITGCVLSVEGLSFEDEKTCPDVINFHIKIKPKPRKYKAKTMWKKPDSKVLSLTYKLGPFKHEVDPKSNVCIRLYGKKKTFAAKAKCYGECFVLLKTIFDAPGILMLHRHFLPKSASTIGGSENPLPTSSEGE